MNRNVDATTYNGYTIAPPYTRAVNSTNMLYAQQLPIIAMGGPTYTYTNQNTCSQLHNPYTSTQAIYPQPSVITQPQNFNMQGPNN